MKLRTGQPWMTGTDYGRTLSGLSVNLLVRRIEPAVHFARTVLDAEVVYADPDFAVLKAQGSQWMLHADHCYDRHPFRAALDADPPRGRGVELRVHGIDPDRAERAARASGYEVLAAASDKRHGLREAYILDADGYVWVVDAPLES